MTLLALNTGMRRGELTSIKWNDVNLHTKIITIRAGYAKSAKARHIPLNSEALDVLKRYRKQHSGEGRLFDVFSVKKSWNALMTNAGIRDFRFHDLRHTFASKLVAAGVDLNTVRELLGHADIRMTLRYAHLAPEHKAAAVQKLVKAGIV
jgi:integrase